MTMFPPYISLTEREAVRLAEFINDDDDLRQIFADFGAPDTESFANTITRFCHIARRESASSPGQFPALDRLAEATVQARARNGIFADPVTPGPQLISGSALPTSAELLDESTVSAIPMGAPTTTVRYVGTPERDRLDYVVPQTIEQATAASIAESYDPTRPGR
jgi:hypothetical protein